MPNPSHQYSDICFDVFLCAPYCVIEHCKLLNLKQIYSKISISVHSIYIQIGYERGYRSLLCQEILPGTGIFSVDLYTACLVGKKTHGSIIKLQALT